jgi:PHD/YefM family antitoxin component YafN of YafNO toxin-antitoxin module
MTNERSDDAKKLIEFVRTNLDFEKIIESYSRGGEYTPLFLRTEETDADGLRLVWMNAWLASDDHVAEIEASSAHLQGRYFQHGFHPGYGTNPQGSFYEPIYGGSLEPLVLGWSADSKRIDPELSQEFERCYNLTRIDENQKTVWNSWKESLDEVVILEKHGHTNFVLTARTDFIRDFQYLRKRWLLVGVYGEWGNRMAGEPHIWAVHHEVKKNKLYLFGIPEDSRYKYVEAQGYFLSPVPLEEGFSAGWGLGVPAGLKATAEKIEFQTSAGRVKPWDVREGSRHDGRASATAAFDQEVLRRYQNEPGADVSLGNIGQLEITSKKVHLRRIAMLLGTEYVSVWLGDFVEGVPPSEWAHWQSFNIPFIGFDRQKELFEAKNLFRMVARLIRQIRLINKRWLWITEDDRIPFNLRHNTEKDYEALTKALPRHPDAHELIDRAKALDGLIIECIGPTPLKAFLKRTGFATKDVEGLGSIKLLSTFMMVARIAETVEEWHDSTGAALSYAHKKVASWQKGTLQDLAPEELELIELTAQEFEIMFMLNDLRLLAAHAIAAHLEEGIDRAFKDHSSETIDHNQYRNPILWLYDTLWDCLEKCAT